MGLAHKKPKPGLRTERPLWTFWATCDKAGRVTKACGWITGFRPDLAGRPVAAGVDRSSARAEKARSGVIVPPSGPGLAAFRASVDSPKRGSVGPPARALTAHRPVRRSSVLAENRTSASQSRKSALSAVSRGREGLAAVGAGRDARQQARRLLHARRGFAEGSLSKSRK